MDILRFFVKQFNNKQYFSVLRMNNEVLEEAHRTT